MPDSDLNDIVTNLLRDLEISPDELASVKTTELQSEIGDLVSSAKDWHKIGLDASLFAASLGDWDYALVLINEVVDKEMTSTAVFAWKLRCLVESKRYSEALALADTHEWPKDLLIHVKYLSGLSYLQLKMSKRARNNFEWVERQDSGYREVARLLAKV